MTAINSPLASTCHSSSNSKDSNSSKVGLLHLLSGTLRTVHTVVGTAAAWHAGKETI
jgi:hypothetical protein